MPIYEYQCQKCEGLSEIFQKVSDPHPEECPRCGAEGTLKKLISQTSFALKGEGWYVTDYKPGKSSTAKAESVNESSPASDAKASEATPAAEGPKETKAASNESISAPAGEAKN